MKHSTFALSAIAALVLSACGGGGSSSPVASNSLSGTVIDGYIEGATVCLDLNNNQACDTGEPTATTGKDGSYKLDTTGLSSAQLKAAHLLTTVPTTAKDADDNGKTLAEAGKSAFSLLAPATAYVSGDGSTIRGAVISPLTTLVSHEMIAGNNLPLDTAEKNVRTRMNLDASTNLRQDFVAEKNTSLTEKAQMVAMTIAEVKKTALADTSNPSQQQALLAALDYLRARVATLQEEFNNAKAASGSAKPLEAVKSALAKEAAKPDIPGLVSQAQQSASSTPVTSVSSLLNAGIYGAQYILEVCASTQSGSTASYCTPHYYKVSGSNGTFNADNDYELSNGQWKKMSSSGDALRLTDDGKWVTDNCSSGTYTEDGTGAATLSCGGWTERVSARAVDASGKTLKQLGLNPPSSLANTTMPSGAMLYWFTFGGLKDRYTIYSNNPVQEWVSSLNKAVSITSLDQLISTYSGSKTSGYSWAGLRFKFDDGGNKTGGTVTLMDSSNWGSTQAIGKADYEIRTVGQQQVLIIKKPAPQNADGAYVMFAVKDGVVYGGSYRNTAMVNPPEASFNKTMINALLKAGSKPEVLD